MPQAVKKSLVLAGGGMRLAYQAGVLRAFREQGLNFTHADATSGGIFNLAMMCSDLSIDQMEENWRTLNVTDFAALLPFKSYIRFLRWRAMASAKGIRQKVFPHLGIDLAKINQAQGLTATFNVCNYTDKTNEAITQDKITEDHLIAGVSLPMFMPAVQIEDKTYIDAVWIKDANIMEAVKRGAEEIWLVWAIGNHEQYYNGLFNQYVHMIEMSACGALNEAFEQVKLINALIKAGQSPYGQTQPIKLHVIKPQHPLPLDPDFFFKKIDAATLIDMGYRDTYHYLRAIQKDGKQLSTTIGTQATKMKSVSASHVISQAYLSEYFSISISTMVLDDTPDLVLLSGHINDLSTDESATISCRHGQWKRIDNTCIIYMHFQRNGKTYKLNISKSDEKGVLLWQGTLNVTQEGHTEQNISVTLVPEEMNIRAKVNRQLECKANKRFRRYLKLN